MLEVNAPVGNIFLGEEFDELKSENFERLRISRIELEKRILRRKGDRGTDVGFNLEPGVKLRHGDVINNGDTKIVIEQSPEKVISITFIPPSMQPRANSRATSGVSARITAITLFFLISSNVFTLIKLTDISLWFQALFSNWLQNN